MARPRKYATPEAARAADAVRKAAARASKPDTVNRTASKPDTPNVRIEPAPGAPVEQWRLDAQVYLKTGKLPKLRYPSPGFVSFVDQPHVPHDPQASPWLGAGRGVVREFKGKAYVLVARHRGNVDPDALEHGVVSAQDFAARLTQRCEHKRAGWQCHAC